MKLILTKLDYLSMNPVYGFELDDVVLKQLNMTIDEYYQAAMFQTQRIINTYMQDFLAQKNWDISNLNDQLQEKIKNILFMECEFLHQNQLFFKKTNDVTYSNAGQQTFTFNTNLDDSTGPSLIPDYVAKAIKNTGILSYAGSWQKLAREVNGLDNEFADGYLVPDVEWNSKADNVMSLNGENVTLSQAIKNLSVNNVSKNDADYLNVLNLAENFSDETNQITSLKLLSGNVFTPNKKSNDYAQIRDLQDLWTGSNNLINNNTKDIQNLQEAINNLSGDFVTSENLASNLAGKANTNWDNVQLSPRAKIQNVQVNYDGTLTYEQAAGNIAPRKWNPDTEYFEGETTWVEIAGVAKIFLARPKEGNINKNPANNPDYWISYTADFDLTGFVTKDEANNKYLAKTGGSLSGQLDMQNNEILNASNLVDKSMIDDNSDPNVNVLWSSQKTSDEIKSQALNLNSDSIQNVNGPVNFNNEIVANNNLGIFNGTVGGTFTPDEQGNLNLVLSNNKANLLVNGELIKTDLSNYYNKQEVDALISSGGGKIKIDYTFVQLYSGAGYYTLKPNNTIYFRFYAGAPNNDFRYSNSELKRLKSKIKDKGGYYDSVLEYQINAVTNTDANKLFYLTYQIDLYNEYINVSVTNIASNDQRFYPNYLELRAIFLKIDSGGGGGTLPPDLSNYYTKSEIDSQISNLQNQIDNIETGDVDLSNYYTKLEIDNQLENTNNQIKELDSKLDNQISNLQEQINNLETGDVDLTNYYNKSEVDAKVSNLEMEINSNKDLIDNNTDDIHKNMTSINELQTSNTSLNQKLDTLQVQVENNTEMLSNGYIIKYRGQFVLGTPYKAYDYVTDDGKSYFAKKDNINEPLTSTEFWEEKTIQQTVDLTNYYTKQETETLIQNNLEPYALKTELTTINENLDELDTSVKLINQAIPNLLTKADANLLYATLNGLSETNKNIADMKNTVDAINTRLTTLENDWAINKTTDMLLCWVGPYDGQLKINVYSTLGKQITNLTGQWVMRFMSGYTDSNTDQYINTYSGSFSNGIVRQSYQANSKYFSSFEYFNIAINVTYNNKQYRGHYFAYSKPFNDYDFTSLNNYNWVVLLPV